jgi:octaprenyl-diphosphate synthase
VSGSPAGLSAQVRSLVGRKVDAVESSLVRHLDDCPSYLRDAALSVLRRGGKRLRPYLHLLSADLLGYDGEEDVLFATVVEYLHVASLVHDDVIDESALRRGSPTLNEELGNTRSVLVGDYLCVKALALAAAPQSRELHELVTRTTLDLIEGETLQEIMVGRLDVTEEECFRAIELKTGRLMACSCESAAVLAGAGAAQRAKLREYGLQLGMAFQLADDMLDFVSNEATLGKPVLNDLREGKLSIPAIHALRVGGPDVKRVIEAVITDRGFARSSPEDVVRAIRETGGLDATMDFARDAATKAREALDGLRDGLPLEALRFATEYAVTRTF